MIRYWIIVSAVLWFGAACRSSGAAGDEAGGKGDKVATQTEHKHTNSLIKSTSPYLLQHAHNPVDWYEWGPEALEKAKKEDKPIFLSIGYSACHWCHVMEHECFEREEVADILNANFISIKVDREERPDIDEIYMQATVTMTGRGGWPMSLFVTPEGIPFYAGTYFPRVQFIRLLNQIERGWREQRESLLEQGDKINARLQQWAAAASGNENLIAFETVSQTANRMVRYFDASEGGISGGGTNKFPPSMSMELMLREYIRSGESKLLAPVELTLTKMARGGIYDHLGGGICRYSTDTKWLVPHFEKMLYDQALVSSIYIDGYLVTKDRLFADTARSIFDYVIRDLQSPEGGFYSTRDADSEGMEGKFYIWTVEQVTEVLGEDDAKLFCTYYDVTARGNWFESRGHAPAGPKNILNIKRDLDTVARDLGLEPGDLGKRLANMRIKMLEARAKRVPPGLDDKILTGWNGLMIASLAKGGRVFDEPKYTNAAARAADFVFKELRRDGHLLRTYRQGHARLTGYLTDYAYFIEGLLNLYEATFDVRWLNEAVALNDDLIRRYFDPEGGGFFFTASDGEKLIARSKDPNDGAVPSGNSVQAMNLLRLALLVDSKDYKAKAESIFRAFASLVKRSPTQFERMLCAVDFYGGRPKEIAIIGKLDDAQTRAMLGTVFGRFQPNRIVALVDGDTAPPDLVKRIPLLRGKSRIEGKTTAYVCENYACQRPVTTAAELAKQLAR